MRRAARFSAFNRPFLIQNGEGGITHGFLTQLSSTFPTATLPHYTDANVWKSDVVKERFEMVRGYMRVPEHPGLGVTLDRDELARLEALPMPVCSPFVVRSRYADGRTLHFIHDTEKAQDFLCVPNLSIMPQCGYADPVETDYWDNNGSEEFGSMFARCQEGPVWV